jgi:hypothetical protein
MDSLPQKAAIVLLLTVYRVRRSCHNADRSLYLVAGDIGVFIGLPRHYSKINADGGFIGGDITPLVDRLPTRGQTTRHTTPMTLANCVMTPLGS